jgi:uncharacterized RDD family membrane protein YckC
MATTPAEASPSRLFCTECGRPFAAEDLARFGAEMVCAECKPRFVQRVREGVPTAMAVQYGGFWRRFVAVVIDWVILMVINFPIQLLMVPILGTSLGRGNSMRPGLMFGLIGLNWFLSTAIAVIYYAYFLSQKSATPGKMVMGLKVITATGGRISVSRAIARYFAQILSGLILCIGYIMAGFDSEKRALHDYICSTRVICQV